MARPPAALNISPHRRVKSIMRNIGCLATVTAAAVAVIGLAGCGATVSGVAVAGDISTVATATVAPSSMTRPVPIKELVAEAAAGVRQYWDSAGVPISVPVLPTVGDPVCSGVPGASRRAAYCSDPTQENRKILYDTRAMEALRDSGADGPLAVELVIAHEFGHAIQNYAGKLGKLREAPRVSATSQVELSADCLAGVYSTSVTVPDSELMAALSKTGMGSNADRIAAFRDGATVELPVDCLTKYGG